MPEYHLSCQECGHLWWSENPQPACCPQCGNRRELAAPTEKPKTCAAIITEIVQDIEAERNWLIDFCAQRGCPPSVEPFSDDAMGELGPCRTPERCRNCWGNHVHSECREVVSHAY